MVDEEKALLEEADGEQSSGGGLFNPKLAIPIIIGQIAISYFLASFVIVPTFFSPAQAGEKSEAKEDETPEAFGVVYQLQDVIVNPAESQGARYVVVNIAFEVAGDGDVGLLEKREPQLRDLLIQLISSKPVERLDGPDDKEKLRVEIKDQVAKLLPKNHLKNVYFVNYIIQ